jgi:hypothetical protein
MANRTKLDEPSVSRPRPREGGTPSVLEQLRGARASAEEQRAALAEVLGEDWALSGINVEMVRIPTALDELAAGAPPTLEQQEAALAEVLGPDWRAKLLATVAR